MATVSRRDGCIRTRRKLEHQPPIWQIPTVTLKLLADYQSGAFELEQKARQRDIRMRLRRYHLIPAATKRPLAPTHTESKAEQK